MGHVANTEFAGYAYMAEAQIGRDGYDEFAMGVMDSLIDDIGLDGVLEALVKVCAAKSDHIESMWQDCTLARDWSDAALAIEDAMLKVYPYPRPTT